MVDADILNSLCNRDCHHYIKVNCSIDLNLLLSKTIPESLHEFWYNGTELKKDLSDIDKKWFFKNLDKHDQLKNIKTYLRVVYDERT